MGILNGGRAVVLLKLLPHYLNLTFIRLGIGTMVRDMLAEERLLQTKLIMEGSFQFPVKGKGGIF